MTRLLIEVFKGSHDCCGEQLSRGARTVLSCRLPGGYGLIRPVDLVADNHSGMEPFIVCDGHVVDITMMDSRGRSQPIQRLPSGRARRGHDDNDDGTTRSLTTGDVLDSRGCRFHVAMDVIVLTGIDDETRALLKPTATA